MSAPHVAADSIFWPDLSLTAMILSEQMDPLASVSQLDVVLMSYQSSYLDEIFALHLVKLTFVDASPWWSIISPEFLIEAKLFEAGGYQITQDLAIVLHFPSEIFLINYRMPTSGQRKKWWVNFFSVLGNWRFGAAVKYLYISQ